LQPVRFSEGPPITQSVLDLIIRHGIPLVALLIFAGELGLPTGIPAEVALLLAGSYAVHSVSGLIAGLALIALADVAGTTTLNLAMRTGGVRLLALLRRRREAAGEEAFARWRRRLAGHDALAVFVGRLLPLVRMPVTIGAGLLRLPLRSFFLGAVPAAVLWAGVPFVLGYELRASVHGFAMQYTRAAHIALLLSPAIGLAATVVWWIQRGGTARGRLRRGRAVVGFVAAILATAYVVKTAWTNEWAEDRGRAALPWPILELWLAALASLAVALLAVVITDLRLSRGKRRLRPGPPFSVRFEIVVTATWFVLLAGLGVVVTVIELRYQAL
jgi:membrane protein DedA with SNARE-associated domain